MDPIVNRNAPRVVEVASTLLGQEERAAVMACFDRNWISMGPVVAEFEEEFASAHGKRYGVGCCSGTSALQLALHAASIGRGDAVVVPTLTMVAVANAVLYVGATPIFVDSESETGNPDPRAIKETLSDERVKAVILPHLYGEPASAIHRLDWRAAGVVLVEDCAEAHYASFEGGRPVGSVGDMATFSMFSNKIISAAEAGMVLTDNRDQADRLRRLRSHAFTPGNHFHHSELAYGYRMSDLHAAVGLAQHRKHKMLVDRRSTVAAWYDRHWPKTEAIIRPVRSPGAVWWVYPVLLASGLAQQRKPLRQALANAGVDSRTYFEPLHRQPHLCAHARGKEFPVADDLAAMGLYLPLHPLMTEEDVIYVCAAIAGFLQVRGLV